MFYYWRTAWSVVPQSSRRGVCLEWLSCNDTFNVPLLLLQMKTENYRVPKCSCLLFFGSVQQQERTPKELPSVIVEYRDVCCCCVTVKHTAHIPQCPGRVTSLLGHAGHLNMTGTLFHLCPEFAVSVSLKKAPDTTREHLWWCQGLRSISSGGAQPLLSVFPDSMSLVEYESGLIAQS